MNNPDIQGVLFDFDGTLAPNLDLPDMRRQVIAATRRAAVPEDVFADRYIVEIIDAAHTWLQTRDADDAQAYFDAAHGLITEFEIRAAKYTQPFPGVADKLAALRASGMRLGVVTRNCRAAVLQVFPQLLASVDALHARDDTVFLKPDPRHLLASLEAIQCAPDNAAMVGDGALDMHAGRELNMYCVGVLSGSANSEALHTAGAHQVIEHCLDLAF